ncbi:FG-GAP-like repeat-containing protein [Thalassotalea maritima]|uniref:FG-GAP-like repeat-containing protein n=1 Tax=Thalassotalea maritima TaxID=3242416 RepID=UPI0035292AF5
MKQSVFGIKKASTLLFIALTLMVSCGVHSKDAFKFEQLVIEATFNITQEPIRANLTSAPGKELIVIGERDGISHMALFALNETSNRYQMQFDIPIPAQYFAYDVDDFATGNTETQQALYFLAADHVAKFKLDEQPDFDRLVDVQSMYVTRQAPYLKQWDFVQDVNDDSLSDVILMGFASLNVYLQNTSGFILQQLPIEPIVEIFDNSVSYTEKPFYLLDMTFDGKKDVVLTADGELHVFAQNPQGMFAKRQATVMLNNSISAVNWWDARGSDGKTVDQSNFSHRNIVNLSDLNNDSIPDLVVLFTQSSGVLDKRTDYEVYLGRNANGRVAFSSIANTAIKSQGTLTQLEFIDVNGDTQPEIMTSSFDISVSQIIGALLSSSVDQDVLIFAMNGEQDYQLAFKDQVQLQFSLSSGRSGAPVVELADLNGDGAQELILSAGDKQLNIFPGGQSTPLINASSQKLEVSLPKNGVFVFSDDLNLDGKDEIMLRYAAEDGKQQQKRLLLIRSE